jgi:hypothetical protein
MKLTRENTAQTTKLPYAEPLISICSACIWAQGSLMILGLKKYICAYNIYVIWLPCVNIVATKVGL